MNAQAELPGSLWSQSKSPLEKISPGLQMAPFAEDSNAHSMHVDCKGHLGN